MRSKPIVEWLTCISGEIELDTSVEVRFLNGDAAVRLPELNHALT